MQTADATNSTQERGNPNIVLEFYFSSGGSETVFLEQLELTAGQVHELRRGYEADHPGQTVTVKGHVLRWEEFFYHESMSPDQHLDLALT